MAGGRGRAPLESGAGPGNTFSKAPAHPGTPVWQPLALGAGMSIAFRIDLALGGFNGFGEHGLGQILLLSAGPKRTHQLAVSGRGAQAPEGFILGIRHQRGDAIPIALDDQTLVVLSNPPQDFARRPLQFRSRDNVCFIQIQSTSLDARLYHYGALHTKS